MIPWLSFLLVFVAQQPPIASVPASMPATEKIAQARDETDYLAVVAPRRALEIGAPRDGVLKSVTAPLGALIPANTALATLETESLMLDLASSRVALKEAEGQRAKATIMVERAKDLRDRIHERPDSFSENERRDAEFNVRVAEEELDIAAAGAERNALDVSRLEDLLRRSEVLAPFEGVVAARYLDAGATVARGASILRLISARDLVVRFALPAELARSIAQGDRAVFITKNSVIETPLEIESVAPEVDAALEMIIVEAAPLDPETASRLQPGADGRVRVTANAAATQPTTAPATRPAHTTSP